MAKIDDLKYLQNRPKGHCKGRFNVNGDTERN